MKWSFRNRQREPGWLALAFEPKSISFVHGQRAPGGKPLIRRCGTLGVGEMPGSAERVAKEAGFGRYQCTTILNAGEYQMLVVEAPNVPAAEVKTAVRWKVKDLIDYPLDEATFDVLDIPPRSDSDRVQSMYAVVTRNDVVKGCMDRFAGARIPLSVIDVAETAQRNVAALFESEQRGVAFLYFGAAQGFLTINFRGELYLTRRLDLGIDQLLADARSGTQEAAERIALELQRTFDHFDRQYPFVAVSRLLLGPEPEDTGLAAYLGQNLDLPVMQAPLREVLDVEDPSFDPKAEWRLFHLVGAALRNGAGK